MKIVFLAPMSTRRRALAVESKRAVDAGHRVLVIAEGGPLWNSEPLDDRVETRWLQAGEMEASEPALVSFLCRRMPLGMLRRARRGRLARPVRRLERAWRRRVVKRLDLKLTHRTEDMRRRYRATEVPAGVHAWDPDWVILHEAEAIDVCVEFLPALLDARPEIRTTYSFEPLADKAFYEPAGVADAI